MWTPFLAYSGLSGSLFSCWDHLGALSLITFSVWLLHHSHRKTPLIWSMKPGRNLCSCRSLGMQVPPFITAEHNQVGLMKCAEPQVRRTAWSPSVLVRSSHLLSHLSLHSPHSVQALKVGAATLASCTSQLSWLLHLHWWCSGRQVMERNRLPPPPLIVSPETPQLLFVVSHFYQGYYGPNFHQELCPTPGSATSPLSSVTQPKGGRSFLLLVSLPSPLAFQRCTPKLYPLDAPTYLWAVSVSLIR